MFKYPALLWAAISLCFIPPAFAEDPATEDGGGMTLEQFEASLNYRQGEIVLADGVATLSVPNSFRYLGPEDAERVLVMAWGNPPGNKTLGMLFPADISPLSDQGWGVVITYEEDGHVSDEDADSIDYDELLQQMQAESKEANKAREQAGYGTVFLEGWASNPYYDRAEHKMHWAKELRFGDSAENTLNYNIRVLGREGVLVLNAVSGMSQLTEIQSDMKHVLAFSNFNEGHRYEDFNPDTDKMATYGLAALVAGGLAAKTGLLSKIGMLLLAGKKFIVVIVIALGALAMRLFKGNKGSEA